MSETNYNVYSLLLKNAAATPDKTFFFFEGEEISYGMGMELTNRTASYLLKQGVKQGDTVILNLPNVPAFLYVFMACAQIGAIAVLVGPVARRYEIDYIVKETKPSLVVTSTQLLDHFSIDHEFFVDISKIWCVDDAHKSRNMKGVLKKEKPYREAVTISGDEAVGVIYTSAMDGFPGGVMMTHRGILGSTKILADSLQKDDVFISVLPLFHAFGLTSSIITPLHGGCPIHLIKKFSPQDVVRDINEKGVTLMNGVPRMFMMINAMLPPGKIFPKLRVCISGGEGISKETLLQLKEKYDLEVREGYGLSEASPIVTWNHVNIENRVGSVGKVMDWNEVKIVDDECKELPVGKEGEVMVKGINVTSGYYNNPEKTAKAFTDGWLHTGDLGKLDADGYLYLTGLKKDMVLNSGFNVYPKEVERILMFHPQIESVKVHVKDDQQPGDILRHFIVAEVEAKKGQKLTDAELKLWCKDNISNYKIPKAFIIK